MLFFYHPRGICPWGCAATHWKSDLCHLESWNEWQSTADAWFQIMDSLTQSYKLHKIETAVDESYEVDQIDMRFLKVTLSIHGYPLNSTSQGELAGATGRKAGGRNAKSELGGRNKRWDWNKNDIRRFQSHIIHWIHWFGKCFFGGKPKSLQDFYGGRLSISFSLN